MCRRAGTQLAFTVFAAAKGKDETAGDTGVSKENAGYNRVSGNSKADFSGSARGRHEELVRPRMPHDSWYGGALCTAASQRIIPRSDHAVEAWEGATANGLPLI